MWLIQNSTSLNTGFQHLQILVFILRWELGEFVVPTLWISKTKCTSFFAPISFGLHSYFYHWHELTLSLSLFFLPSPPFPISPALPLLLLEGASHCLAQADFNDDPQAPEVSIRGPQVWALFGSVVVKENIEKRSNFPGSLGTVKNLHGCKQLCIRVSERSLLCYRLWSNYHAQHGKSNKNEIPQ